MFVSSDVPRQVVLSLPCWHASSHNLRLSSMTFDVRKHSFKFHLRQMDPEHSPFWQTWVLPLHSVRSRLGGGSGHVAEVPLHVERPLHSPSSLHSWCRWADTYLQFSVQHWPWLGLHWDPVGFQRNAIVIIRAAHTIEGRERVVDRVHQSTWTSLTSLSTRVQRSVRLADLARVATLLLALFVVPAAVAFLAVFDDFITTVGLLPFCDRRKWNAPLYLSKRNSWEGEGAMLTPSTWKVI